MKRFTYNSETKSFADKPKLLYGVLVRFKDGRISTRTVTGYDRDTLKETLDRYKAQAVNQGYKAKHVIF